MKNDSIFSIGHGNKKIDCFISELKSFGIKYLLDIRSKPFSKWNPQFNQSELKAKLDESGIKYVFMGDNLGGLPQDRSCYDFNGKVIYTEITKKEFFKKGLERLIVAHEKGIPLVIMCSETKPEECHRSKLVGQELLKNHISLKHIISDHVVKSQETIMTELTKGRGTIDLFGIELEFTSRKVY